MALSIKEKEGNPAFNSMKKKISYKTISLVIIIVIALLGVGSAIYFYNQYSALKANPNLEAQKETQALVSKVGGLMQLPADETPTVATVSDANKLKDQTFFKDAKNGDKLLAYTKAMEAILYRPSINKIIAVAPIVINNNTVTSPPVGD